MAITMRGAARGLTEGHIARSSAGLMGATVVNSGLGYVFWIVVARVLSPAQVGTANALISAAILASMIGDIGLRTYVIQELPGIRTLDDWSDRVSSAFVMSMISSGVTGIIMWALLRFISPSVFHQLSGLWPIVFVVLAVAGAAFNLLDGIQTAERRPLDLLARNTLNALAKIAVMVALVLLGLKSAHGVLLATTIAYLVAIALGAGVGLGLIRPGWRFSPSRVGSFFRERMSSLAGHHLITMGGQLPMYVLPLEVVGRLSTRDNGQSALTWMVGSVFFMVSPAVSSALFAEGRWNAGTLKQSTRRASMLIALLLAPPALFMLVFGHQVLGLFGPGYAHAGYAMLTLLVASAVPDAVTNVRIAVYRARLQLRRAAVLNLSMAASALVLAWLLLPHLGITAVGLSWLIAQSAGALWVLLEWLADRGGYVPAHSTRPQAEADR